MTSSGCAKLIGISGRYLLGSQVESACYNCRIWGSIHPHRAPQQGVGQFCDRERPRCGTDMNRPPSKSKR